MKRLTLFLLGIISALCALIALARLRQFLLEPDYVRPVMEGNWIMVPGKLNMSSTVHIDGTDSATWSGTSGYD